MAEDFWQSIPPYYGIFRGVFDPREVKVSDGKPLILATARELYGRAVYSHKTHEKEREIWSGKVCLMMKINIWLAALTTLSAIISAWMNPFGATLSTAILATGSTGFLLWQSDFDPIGKENQHRTAAKELLWIREQLLLLIVGCTIGSTPPEELQKNLDSLVRELTSVYKFAPNTSPEAYSKAQVALQQGEFTFNDEEIDKFLPVALRKHAMR